MRERFPDETDLHDVGSRHQYLSKLRSRGEGDDMKCPKCKRNRFRIIDDELGSLRARVGHTVLECLKCGMIVDPYTGQEKVPLVDPWNPYMADDDGEKP